MYSYDEFVELGKKIKKRVKLTDCEENTKQYLINPFLEALGYSTNDPEDVRFEYTCDYGSKGGMKVDYAVFDDGNIAFLLEAKAVNSSDWSTNQNNLKNLDGYYRYSDAKLALFTNGLEYRFFSDLDKDNVMDDTPFHIMDITNLNREDMDLLVLIAKGTSDINKLRSNVRSVDFKTDLMQWLIKQKVQLSQSFASLLRSEINSCPSEISDIQDVLSYVLDDIDEKLDTCDPPFEVKVEDVGEGEGSLSFYEEDEAIEGMYRFGDVSPELVEKCKPVCVKLEDDYMECKAFHAMLDCIACLALRSGGKTVDDLVNTGLFSKNKSDMKTLPRSISSMGGIYYDASMSASAAFRKANRLLEALKMVSEDFSVGLILRSNKNNVNLESLLNERRY